MLLGWRWGGSGTGTQRKPSEGAISEKELQDGRGLTLQASSGMWYASVCPHQRQNSRTFVFPHLPVTREEPPRGLKGNLYLLAGTLNSTPASSATPAAEHSPPKASLRDQPLRSKRPPKLEEGRTDMAEGTQGCLDAVPAASTSICSSRHIVVTR